MMTFKRKHNSIPASLWFFLSVLYFEVLFVVSLWAILNMISLLKYGAMKISIVEMPSFIAVGHFYILWIALPIFLGYSISLLKSAITEVSFREEENELILTYYSAASLFLRKKVTSISFDELDYFVDRSAHPTFNKIILPLLPTEVIIFYRDDYYLLQFGCTLGWTKQQFVEIKSRLCNIKQPCPRKKSF